MATVGLVLSGVVPFVAATAAGAVGNARLVVTTTADTVKASDGLLSLREAVTRANAQAGADTIVLAADTTYTLSRCDGVTTEDDTNASGDLDATDPDGLTIESAAVTVADDPTIDQTCPVASEERVLQGVAGPLTLDHVATTGGAGVQAGAIAASDGLSLTDASVSGAFVVQGVNSHTPAAVAGTGGPMSIVGSIIEGTSQGAGIADVDASGAAFTLSDDSVSGNGTNVPGFLTDPYAAGVVDARPAGTSAPLEIDHVTITGNTTYGPGCTVDDHPGCPNGAIAGGLYTQNPLQMTDSTVSANQSIEGGGVFAGAGGSIESTTIEHNDALYGGGLLASGMAALTIADSTISGNHGSMFAGGISSGEFGDAPLQISRSLVTGNDATEAAAIASCAPLELTNSSVTHNTATTAGGISAGKVGITCWDDTGPTPPVSLDQVSLVDNTTSGTDAGNDVVLAPAPTDTAPPTFAVRASVISTRPSANDDCALNGAMVVSGGYSLSTDVSCGLGAAVGDQPGGVDPLVTVDADGVPTPGIGSPLIDRIPAGNPGCPGTDEQGTARPIGFACDIGAIEAPASPPDSPTNAFTPMSPVRVLDTRNGTGGLARFGPAESQTLVLDTNGVVPDDVSSVVVNLTATNVTASTFVLAVPGGVSTPKPASNLNLTPGQTAANLVTVGVGRHSTITLFNHAGGVDLVADVVGYYRLGDGDAFTALAPTRLADTRATSHIGAMHRFGRREMQSLTVTGGAVPPDADAVEVNITVTNPSVATYVTAFPAGTTQPLASTVNVVDGETRANLAIVKVGAGGAVTLFNYEGRTDVVVDVVGYFRAAAPARPGLVTIVPQRILDTRGNHVGPPVQFGPGTSAALSVAGALVPADATAVVINVTLVGPSQPTYLTLWPTGSTRPLASSLNAAEDQIVPNLVSVEIGSGGQISIYNHTGRTDVLIDVVGYYR
jgi:hypothetical protein